VSTRDTGRQIMAIPLIALEYIGCTMSSFFYYSKVTTANHFIYFNLARMFDMLYHIFFLTYLHIYNRFIDGTILCQRNNMSDCDDISLFLYLDLHSALSN